jgi:hypothetical protein
MAPTWDQLKAQLDDVRANGDGTDNSGNHRTGNTGNRVSREKVRERESTLYRLLLDISQRDDGYLRLIPDGSGKSCYYKWKWTRGPKAGYYVMAVVSYFQIDYGLQLLVDKMQAVDAGTSKPVKDTRQDY